MVEYLIPTVRLTGTKKYEYDENGKMWEQTTDWSNPFGENESTTSSRRDKDKKKKKKKKRRKRRKYTEEELSEMSSMADTMLDSILGEDDDDLPLDETPKEVFRVDEVGNSGVVATSSQEDDDSMAVVRSGEAVRNEKGHNPFDDLEEDDEDDEYDKHSFDALLRAHEAATTTVVFQEEDAKPAAVDKDPFESMIHDANNPFTESDDEGMFLDDEEESVVVPQQEEKNRADDKVEEKKAAPNATARNSGRAKPWNVDKKDEKATNPFDVDDVTPSWPNPFDDNEESDDAKATWDNPFADNESSVVHTPEATREVATATNPFQDESVVADDEASNGSRTSKQHEKMQLQHQQQKVSTMSSPFAKLTSAFQNMNPFAQEKGNESVISEDEPSVADDSTIEPPKDYEDYLLNRNLLGDDEKVKTDAPSPVVEPESINEEQDDEITPQKDDEGTEKTASFDSDEQVNPEEQIEVVRMQSGPETQVHVVPTHTDSPRQQPMDSPSVESYDPPSVTKYRNSNDGPNPAMDEIKRTFTLETENTENESTDYDASEDDEDIVTSSKRLLRASFKRMEYQQQNDEIKNLREQISRMKEQAEAMSEQLRRAVETKCDLVLAQTELERSHEQQLIRKDNELKDLRDYIRMQLEEKAITELDFMNEIATLSAKLAERDEKINEMKIDMTQKDATISRLEKKVAGSKGSTSRNYEVGSVRRLSSRNNRFQKSIELLPAQTV